MTEEKTVLSQQLKFLIHRGSRIRVEKVGKILLLFRVVDDFFHYFQDQVPTNHLQGVSTVPNKILNTKEHFERDQRMIAGQGLQTNETRNGM